MTRVLISALGAGVQGSGGYKTTTYNIDGKDYTDVAFIARALCEHYRINRLFMVGTERSIWDEVYRSFAGSETDEATRNKLKQKTAAQNGKIDENDLLPVVEVIDSYLGNLHQPTSNCFLIKYGLNNDELMYNFDVFKRIGECLQDGDEVYLDITHSFRSLALFQYMMVNYLENLAERKFEVKAVLYGMFEARDEYGDKVPVVNLIAVYELSKWIKGMHELREYGSGYVLVELLNAQGYENIAIELLELSEVININYLPAIRLKHGDLARNMILPNLTGPASIVSTYFTDFINQFANKSSDYEFQMEMACWCFKNRRYATGYIVLYEALITRLCEIYELDAKSKVTRDEAITRLIESKEGKYKKLKRIRERLVIIRNDIAHVRDRNNDYHKDISDWETLVDNVNELCNSLEANEKKPQNKVLDS